MQYFIVGTSGSLQYLIPGTVQFKLQLDPFLGGAPPGISPIYPQQGILHPVSLHGVVRFQLNHGNYAFHA